MRKMLWNCIYIVRFQQNHINKIRYPYIVCVFLWSWQWMWTIRRIRCQIMKILVSCRIFALVSTYLRSNILQKLLSTIDIISENCRTLHLKPPSLNVIHMVTQSVQSLSARLLIQFELLYRQKGQRNRCHVLPLTFVYSHQTHSVNTEHCEAEQSCAA
jgi:hypothetical protein